MNAVDFEIDSLLDEVSPADRLRILEDRRVRSESSDQKWDTCLLAAGFSIFAIYLVPWIHGPIHGFVKGMGVVAKATSDVVEAVAPDFDRPAKIGEKIAGYEVTSGFGPRTSPTAGASSDHKGVDLGTPTGTDLKAWAANSKVECLSDPGGYGSYLQMTVPSVPNTIFLAGHLSSCTPGTYSAGQTIAKTGGKPGAPGSGTSTGAHLHWGQKVNGAFIDPKVGYLWAIMLGEMPKPLFSRPPKTEGT